MRSTGDEQTRIEDEIALLEEQMEQVEAEEWETPEEEAEISRQVNDLDAKISDLQIDLESEEEHTSNTRDYCFEGHAVRRCASGAHRGLRGPDTHGLAQCDPRRGRRLRTRGGNQFGHELRRPPLQEREDVFSHPGPPTSRSHAAAARVGRMGGENLVGFSKKLRADLGLEIGDVVDVVITLDAAPREIAVPPELAAAFAADSAAKAAFDALAPSPRKEFTRWIDEAKREQTRRSRVDQALKMLREGRTRG